MFVYYNCLRACVPRLPACVPACQWKPCKLDSVHCRARKAVALCPSPGSPGDLAMSMYLSVRRPGQARPASFFLNWPLLGLPSPQSCAMSAQGSQGARISWIAFRRLSCGLLYVAAALRCCACAGLPAPGDLQVISLQESLLLHLRLLERMQTESQPAQR